MVVVLEHSPSAHPSDRQRRIGCFKDKTYPTQALLTNLVNKHIPLCSTSTGSILCPLHPAHLRNLTRSGIASYLEQTTKDLLAQYSEGECQATAITAATARDTARRDLPDRLAILSPRLHLLHLSIAGARSTRHRSHIRGKVVRPSEIAARRSLPRPQ